jgi:hypothetical protein
LSHCGIVENKMIDDPGITYLYRIIERSPTVSAYRIHIHTLVNKIFDIPEDKIRVLISKVYVRSTSITTEHNVEWSTPTPHISPCPLQVV